MRKWMLVVLFCSALGMGGCASKEMVKTQEPMAPSVSTPVAPPPKGEMVPPEAPLTPSGVNESGAIPETPAREAVLPQESRQTEKAAALAAGLQKIYFDFDSAAISEGAREILAKNAQLLTRQSSAIQIEGHCDERGSDEYNLALGERRARSAKDYLVRLGVPAERLSIISYGSEKPADSGHSEAAYAKNRRDEFVVR